LHSDGNFKINNENEDIAQISPVEKKKNEKLSIWEAYILYIAKQSA